jgi:hypothetical protein
VDIGGQVPWDSESWGPNQERSQVSTFGKVKNHLSPTL